ncbi:MAG: 4-hydroxy-tetrahydrodipicolinate reductase [Pseudomonadota bacterium]
MTSPALRILLSGASGRMGQQLIAAINAEANMEWIGQVDRNHPQEHHPQADVLIDFSVPEGCLHSLDYAAEHQLPMVIGTTGLDAAQQARIEQVANTLPICQAANFSIGIAVLRSAAEQIAKQLGTSFDIELTESHHRDKRDAPSGTALWLAERLNGVRAGSIQTGRSGPDNPRQDGDITIHSVRGGDVIGEHSVLFLGPSERIELSHLATDRQLFARGALRAAKWLVDQPNGLYSLNDVLKQSTG